MLSDDDGNVWRNVVCADPAPICAFDTDFRLIAFNAAHNEEFRRVNGFDTKIGDVFPDLFIEEQRDAMRALMARALAGEAFVVVAEFGRPELGQPHWAIRYTPIRNARGEVVAAYHRAEDVSARMEMEAELRAALDRLDRSQSAEAAALALAEERRRAEAAVRESEARFRTMADSAPVMMWVTDPVGQCTYLNRRWYEFTGQVPPQGEGLGWLDAVHPDDRAHAGDAFLSANAEQRDYRTEFRVRRSDGVYRWAIDAAAARFDTDGTYLGYVGSVIDIDDRREREEELRETTARAEQLAAERAAILGQLDEGVIVTDAIGRITFVNDAATRIHGGAQLDVVPEDYVDSYNLRTIDGDAYPVAELPLVRAVRQGEAVRETRWLIRRPDGRDVLAVGAARPVLDNDGRRLGAVLTVRDDTERSRAEAALRTLNDDLEQRVVARTQERDRLWRNTQDLQVVIDGEARFRAVSPAVTAMLGWSADDLIGQTVFDFIVADDEAPTHGALEQAREGPLPTFENRYRHKDGGVRWISWVASPEGELIYASGRHITAEKEREAQLEAAREALRQSQKMEAVGQLTGGIAHDFNNMLAVVIGSLDLLGRRLGDGDARARRYVDAATDGARRAALLTQRLLAFSRQQPLRPEHLEVGKLVTGMSALIRGSLGSNIRFETVLAGGGWHAHADPNQLENVLLNLAVNARDAMPDGGRLTIETQNAHLDARYAAAYPGVPAGQYVLIAVTDTGGGMDEAVIAKAFDPFFTTKEVGKGTGLGLSQVYGFVKQSGGHVKIYSEPGQGTTVKVYLPRAMVAERDDAQDVAAGDMPMGEQEELILVVEDEPAVRQFSVDALTELGYRVIEADGATAALRLLDAHPEIAMMFTDIVMPDVNGAKLAELARRQRPGLKVLFTTGYTRNAVVHNGVLDPGVELVGKPFTIEELAAKVREVLDRPDVTPR